MSKDIQKGYFSKRSMIIAVVLTAGIFIGSVGWYLEIASADLSQQEVNQYIDTWHVLNAHKFVSQQELAGAHEVINEAIAAPHIEIEDNENKILLNRQTINELKIEIAKLKIRNTGTGTPSQGTISVSVAESCYEHGDVVNFEGMATPSRQLTSEITPVNGGKDVFEATPTTNTASNGSFNLFWVIPDGIDTGTYIAKLKDSGGKFGEITVSVRDSC